MATPQGGLAKLWFKPEVTYATPVTGLESGNAFRIYFDRLNIRSAKTPWNFQEISGYSVDYATFEEDPQNLPGMDLELSMRYYGAHLMLLAHAMGDITTSGASAPFTHIISVLDPVPPSASFILQTPRIITSSGATQYGDNLMPGCNVNRLVLSQRSGDILKLRAEMTGASLAYDETPATVPSASGRIPEQALVNWFHKESGATGITIDIDPAGSPVEINCRSWELTIDNKLVPSFLIQTGKSMPPARDDFREIRLKMEIEVNTAWREFMTAYGDAAGSLTSDFSVKIGYVNPNVANESLKIYVNNCRTIDVPRNVESGGRLYQTVDMRAHFQTGGQPYNDPLQITATTVLDVPYDEGPFV